MPQVNCSVSNCVYWEKGNQCHADEILIDIDSHANRQSLAEFAEELFTAEHKDSASKKSETCCKTFMEKGEFDEE